MFNSIRNTLIGISLSVAATSAAALPITFDFSESGHRLLGTSHTFSEIGLAVKANAFGGGSLSQGSSGLGVGGTHWWDSNQLDGLGPDESIAFSFSSSVRLLGFSLSRVSFYDEATLTVDDSPTMSYNLPGSKWFDRTVEVNTDFIGKDFLFGVTDWNDSYFINSLRVETAEVPEPGTIALFAVGLVGLGLARKRARQ